MQMAVNIMVNGRMRSNTGEEYSNLQMGKSMTGNTLMGVKRVMENTFGRMVRNTQDNGRTMKSMGKA